jgi:DNA excision repair protein ERCC-5
METFFDASIGSGTYAPRKRAPYASKRLQKIVTDFRKEQKLGASTNAEACSSSESSTPDVEPSRTVAQKGRKSKTVSRQTPKTKKRSRQASDASHHAETSSSTSANVSTKKRTRQQKTVTKKRKIARSTSGSDDGGAEDVQDGAGLLPDRPLEVRLRPRNRRYQPSAVDNMEDGDNGVEA